jgi:hypothetical protein
MVATAVDPLRAAVFLITAFVLAGLAHSAWLRSPRSQRWNVPLDGGHTVRGRRIFGANKTVRGFLVMVPAAAITFAALGALAQLASGGGGAPTGLWTLTPGQFAALGAWAATGFMLGELPNSFVKRQLDIAPGEAPQSRVGAVITFLVDRLDSILGMLAAVAIAVPTPWMTWAWVILLGPAIHWSFSVLLFRLGVKARPA